MESRTAVFDINKLNFELEYNHKYYMQFNTFFFLYGMLRNVIDIINSLT